MSKFIIHTPITEGQKAVFKYSILDLNFTEEVTFDFEIKNDIALKNLAIASAISYYKLHLAPEIYVDWHLSESEKEFWQWIYRNGFSELVYKNKLDWSAVDNIKFTSEVYSREGYSPSLGGGQGEVGFKCFKEEALVGIGGGKDSSLVVDILKKINLKSSGYATEVSSTKIIERNAAALGIDFSPVARKIDNQLRVLKEGVYMGHIPVSLIYAFTGIMIAYQKSLKYVFVGNEASADEGNNTWQDRVVNHQWSKTREFEKKVQDFVKENISSELTYASLLRPFSSYKIVELFSKNVSYVHKDFSSCNQNFKVDDTFAGRLWCGECAKCLGTYMLMAEYIEKEKLKEIFGKNLEEDVSLAFLMRSLIGLEEEKPFDCVATRDEMCLAFINMGEDIKSGPLFSSLTDIDLDFVKERAEIGKDYALSMHENFIPKDIFEKMQKVI